MGGLVALIRSRATAQHGAIYYVPRRRHGDRDITKVVYPEYLLSPGVPLDGGR